MKLFRRLAALSVLAAMGCGGAPNEEPQAPKVEPAKAQSELPEPAAEPAPKVKSDGTPTVRLLEAGSAPRAPLRYTPRADQREVMNMVMRMKLGMGSPDAPGEPKELPGTIMRMNVVIDRVDPGGDIEYHFDLAGVDVELGQFPPKMVDQIKGATAALVGMGGHATITDRGIVKNMQVKVPGNVAPATKELLAEMERSMRQMCDPFPEEAVGPGARWDVHARYVLSGLRIDQVRRYTLVSREKNRAKVKFIVEQEAKPQSMNVPNLPPGSSVKLLQLASAGDGTAELETTSMVPRTSKLALKTTSVVSATMKKETAVMRTDMEMDIEMGANVGQKQ